MTHSCFLTEFGTPTPTTDMATAVSGPLLALPSLASLICDRILTIICLDGVFFCGNHSVKQIHWGKLLTQCFLSLLEI